MKKNNLLSFFENFANGDINITTKRKPKSPRRPSTHHEETIEERYKVWHDTKATSFFDAVYKVASGLICAMVILVLLITVSFLPEFGSAYNPVNNEVSERYIEKGLSETGAVNIVSGMILDYRAFDTFGESAVLFTASASVMFLMGSDKKKKESGEMLNENYKVIPRDPIVKNVAKFVIPFVLIFGIYLVLNGHISPGGGFSGGAVMGASLILYSSAYGFKTIRKVVTEKLIKNITFYSLAFYAVAKGYSFFTGANHIPTGFPLGEAGDIISAGLILPLNICVGLIVTCTIYSFYSLFTKGEV